MPEWLPIVVTIALFAATTVNGIIGYFLKQQWDRVKELEAKQEEHRRETQAEFQALRQEFQDHKQQLPFMYVLREDWIRYMGAIERKLDDLVTVVTQLRVDVGQLKQGGD